MTTMHDGPLLFSPRRRPRHAPSCRRLLLVWLTIIFSFKRTAAAYEFMDACTHQRLILGFLNDLPPDMKLTVFPGGFAITQERKPDDDQKRS